MNKENGRKLQWIDWLIFAAALIAYTALMFTLFYRQTLGNVNYYHSDMKAYILEMQGLESGYPFPYPVFFKFAALIHFFLNAPQLSVAIAAAFLNSLSVIILKWFMNRILMSQCRPKGDGKKLLLGIWITVSVFALFFVSMVYPPDGMYLPGIQNRYVGVFSPNPFHNATYNATRPFAIAAFFLFGKILAEYEQKTDLRDHLLFGVFLLLTTMTKPSFTFVLVPAAGLIMLYRLIKAKGKNFIPSVKLGICFIPTFAALLYQYAGVFAPAGEEEAGIGFGLATAWKLHCHNIPLAVGVALGFPALVLILNFKQLKTDKWYRLSWQLMLMSLAEVLFLYEKGYRLTDMNFSWGYMHGLFFVFVASAILLIRRTWLKKGNIVMTIAQWLAFGWHLACGIYYFMGVFAGKLYY